MGIVISIFDIGYHFPFILASASFHFNIGVPLFFYYNIGYHFYFILITGTTFLAPGSTASSSGHCSTATRASLFRIAACRHVCAHVYAHLCTHMCRHVAHRVKNRLGGRAGRVPAGLPPCGKHAVGDANWCVYARYESWSARIGDPSFFSIAGVAFGHIIDPPRK